MSGRIPMREVSIATVSALKERAAALGLTLSDSAARELATVAVTAELPNLLAAVRRQLVNAFERIEHNEAPAGSTAPTMPMSAIPDPTAPETPARRHYELAPDPNEPEDLAALVRQRLGGAVPGAPQPPQRGAPAEPHHAEAEDPEASREAPPLRRSLFGGRRGQASDDTYDGPDRRRAADRRSDAEDRPIFKRPRR